MEWMTEYAEYIRWVSALISYPIMLSIVPSAKEKGSKIRWAIYLIALPLFLISYAFNITLNDIHKNLTQSSLIILLIISSTISAIVYIEVIREFTKNGILWTAKKHYIILAFIVAILTTIKAMYYGLR